MFCWSFLLSFSQLFPTSLHHTFFYIRSYTHAAFFIVKEFTFTFFVLEVYCTIVYYIIASKISIVSSSDSVIVCHSLIPIYHLLSFSQTNLLVRSIDTGKRFYQSCNFSEHEWLTVVNAQLLYKCNAVGDHMAYAFPIINFSGNWTCFY